VKSEALTLALVSAALVACKGASPTPAAAAGPAAVPARKNTTDPAAYYPLAVGNSWTYQVTDASGKHEDTIQIVGRDGPWFIDDHRGRLRVDSDGVRDADRYLLRAPIAASARWSAVENLVVQRFEVTSTDVKVTTQDGAFSGCVVVRNEQPLPEKQGKFVTEWTFAPGVGPVQIRTQTVGPSGTHDQIRLELVAHHVQ
jgi:hypothetical protein